MKYFIVICLFLLSFTSMYAENKLNVCNTQYISPSLFYVKVGGGKMPEVKTGSLVLGIGGRYRKGHHGLDLSLNGQLSTLFLFKTDALLTTKAQYLFYPMPNARHALYFGGGGGYVWSYHERCMPRPLNGSSYSAQFLSLEGVIGCEFRRDKWVKPFLQLELTQPVVFLKGKGHSQYQPGVTLSTGIGF